jgi:hypothetical protein
MKFQYVWAQFPIWNAPQVGILLPRIAYPHVAVGSGTLNILEADHIENERTGKTEKWEDWESEKNERTGKTEKWCQKCTSNSLRLVWPVGQPSTYTAWNVFEQTATSEPLDLNFHERQLMTFRESKFAPRTRDLCCGDSVGVAWTWWIGAVDMGLLSTPLAC